ncbi:MAG: O-antigen ligase family protein [Bacteroidota bacterium]
MLAAAPHRDALPRGADGLLKAGFALLVLALLVFIWMAPLLLLAFPALLVGVGVAWYASRSSLHILAFMLLAFGGIMNKSEGISVFEVAFAGAFFIYMPGWILSQILLYRDRMVNTLTDGALAFFLLYSLFSIGLGWMLGGKLSWIAGEWLALIMLFFYFPVKEQVAHRPQAMQVIFVVLGLLAAVAVARNIWEYQYELNAASYVWEVKQGRATVNEHWLMMAGIAALAWYLHARQRWLRWGLLVFFAAMVAGVIVGQSRAVWVSFLLGTFILFILVRPAQRRTMLLVGSMSVLAGLTVGYAVLGDFFFVVLVGLAERFVSLGTATTQDLSLVNRFIENMAVLDRIKDSPIIGHGFGVPIKYFSLVYEFTRVESFIHNAYLSVWYKHGLIGLVAVMGFYISTVVKGWRLARTAKTAGARLGGMIVAACFIAEALSAITQNSFAGDDTCLLIGIGGGIVAGLSRRAQATDKPALPRVS